MHSKRQKISALKIRISPTKKKKKKTLAKKKDIRPVPRIEPVKKKVKITRKRKEKEDDKQNKGFKPLSEWAGLLHGHPAFILGNAPSINERNLGLLQPYFTIGINRIFYVYDPTILFWQDRQIWNSHKKQVRRLKAVKVCSHTADQRGLFLNFKLGYNPLRFTMQPERLFGRGNTGAIAVQFAVALGCSAIVLLGMDCKYGPGGKTDFYGRNKDHKSYTLRMCNHSLKWIRGNCPVPVFNCSENELWPQRELKNVITSLSPPKKNRNYFIDLFKR